MSVTPNYSNLIDLEFDSSVEQLERTINDIFRHLLELSQQSIIAPQQARLDAQTECYQALNQLNLDSISGGLVLPKILPHEQKHQVYGKPILINLLLAELLIQIDQFFYAGDFNQAGIKIIDYLCAESQLTTSGLIQQEHLTDWHHLSCYFSDQVIHANLDRDQCRLFYGLTSSAVSDKVTEGQTKLKSDLESDVGRCYFQSTSLKQAAEQIDMPIKQAQILEFSIQTKLNQVIAEREKLDNTAQYEPLKNVFAINCQMAGLLSSGYFFSQETQWKQSALQQIHSLITYSENNELQDEDKLNLITAGLKCLQLEFNHSLLIKMLDILSQVNRPLLQSSFNQQSLAQATCNQLSLIASVIKALNQSALLEFRDNQLESSLVAFVTPKWQVKVLDKSSILLDNQLVETKSQYHPFRIIYCV